LISIKAHELTPPTVPALTTAGQDRAGIKVQEGALAKCATECSVSTRSISDEIDRRIAVARANLRQLIEQAAASSGAADEDLISSRIVEQETALRHLTDQREKLAQSGT
jgi:hypothetical protein